MIKSTRASIHSRHLSDFIFSSIFYYRTSVYVSVPTYTLTHSLLGLLRLCYILYWRLGRRLGRRGRWLNAWYASWTNIRIRIYSAIHIVRFRISRRIRIPLTSYMYTYKYINIYILKNTNRKYPPIHSTHSTHQLSRSPSSSNSSSLTASEEEGNKYVIYTLTYESISY